MEDLTDLTFILPIKIESPDRLRNLQSVLGFLNHHFKTNLIVVENNSSNYPIIAEFKNLNTTYALIQQPVFHRTRFINVALEQVKTPVVCVYDVDVLLPPENYKRAVDLITKEKRHIVYPYGFGNYQRQINEFYDREHFASHYDPSKIPGHYLRVHTAHCGHCFFADTEAYRNAGAENEGFVSYAPEDQERYHRFITLDMDVDRIDHGLVYHFEHYRSADSSKLNPFYLDGERKFKEIKDITTKDDMIAYYKNEPYLSKYPTIGGTYK